MAGTGVSIIPYNASHATELLRMLLLLQVDYYQTVASKEMQELDREVNPKVSYQQYINLINADENNWKVFLAATNENKIIGFIIGSVSTDEDLMESVTGKLEDWFIEDTCRSTGVGLKLYTELEKWLKEKGCARIISSTWPGNEVSINMHKQLGFFETEVSFGKKL